jgi:hypothetical protein
MTTSANDPSPDASLEAQLALAQPGMIQGATVPAGSFVDVPADFEGSSRAVLLVLSPTTETGLTASFGGTELQPLDFLGSPVLGADLAPPLNGMVRLTNSTSSPIEAAVLVAPESLRAMSVVVTPSLASVGEPVTVTASLTVSDAGDSPRAQVTDADGAVVADLALSPTGTAGTYSATFTPPHADTYSVASAVDGLRPRRATDVFTVSAGGARLTGNFNETLSDANGNGLADVLLVRPDLSVVRPGSYRVSARLVDASGVVVGVAGTRAELASGDQVVDLRFEGKDIFATGRSGPYRVVDVTLSQDDVGMELEQEVALLGQTGAYDYHQFEHFKIEIDRDGFADETVDRNGDGEIDYLDVAGKVRVDDGGTYAVNALLVAGDGTEVAESQGQVVLATGLNDFTLNPGSRSRRRASAAPFRALRV